MQRLIYFVSVAAVGLMASVANAKPSPADAAKAQATYDEAVKDMLLGDRLSEAGQMKEARSSYELACPKFEAVLKLLPEHAGVGIELARCYEVSGKLATALIKYKSATAWAARDALPKEMAELAVRIRELEPRVPRLRVVVPENVATLPGLTILYDGKPILTPQWGKAFDVNPGSYEIAVSALQKKRWSQRFEASEGKTTEVKVPASLGNDDSNMSGRAITGYAMLSVGGAALLTGVAMGIVSWSKNAASRAEHCDMNNQCNEARQALRTDAQAFGDAAIGLGFGGGALAGIGLFLVAAPKPNTSASQAGLWLGPNGIAVRGNW